VLTQLLSSTMFLKIISNIYKLNKYSIIFFTEGNTPYFIKK
jgi:hypothetical protein